jgi:hypothetical protein
LFLIVNINSTDSTNLYARTHATSKSTHPYFCRRRFCRIGLGSRVDIQEGFFEIVNVKSGKEKSNLTSSKAIVGNIPTPQQPISRSGRQSRLPRHLHDYCLRGPRAPVRWPHCHHFSLPQMCKWNVLSSVARATIQRRTFGRSLSCICEANKRSWR